MSANYVVMTDGGSQLGTSAAAVYTCGANKTARVDHALALNTSAGAVTLTIHRVPSGGTASNANMLVKARSLAAGESYVVRELIGAALAAGDMVQAFSGTGTAVSFQMSGWEFT